MSGLRDKGSEVVTLPPPSPPHSPPLTDTLEVSPNARIKIGVKNTSSPPSPKSSGGPSKVTRASAARTEVAAGNTGL
ncbi:hypothetical protein E2C01_061626 [Portunus trituberculatus]|uniref:Uncharacterized protein n=1 Tax=Portunus trituberculatus TaxID=210409 RepID=A0A5B7H5R6_PORTR|nr:hypothetical protein [Portunus trituberculatus]